MAIGPESLNERVRDARDASVGYAEPAGTSSVPAVQDGAVQLDVARAFRAAFLTVAAFTALGVVLAVTIPLRRL